MLANLLQSSKSTFSWESFLSFFAFKEGMLDTQISALGGWPTVPSPFSDTYLLIHRDTEFSRLKLGSVPQLP
jgi:hypothetical protein